MRISDWSSDVCSSDLFLLGGGGAQLHRPVRPGKRLILLHRRPWHDLELGDRKRSLAMRGPDAIGPRIAAADDDDMLAPRRNGAARGRLRLVIAGVAAVLDRKSTRLNSSP